MRQIFCEFQKLCMSENRTNEIDRIHGVLSLRITKWNPIFDGLCASHWKSIQEGLEVILFPVDPCSYKTTTWGHAKKKARNIGKRKSRQQIFKPCHLQKLAQLLSCQHSKAILPLFHSLFLQCELQNFSHKV